MTHGSQFESLAALVQSLTTPMGLTLDEVRIDVAGASLGFEPFSLSLASPATVEILVSAENIAAFLEEKKVGGLYDIRVQAKDGGVVVQGKAKVVVEVNVSATCKLRVEDRQRLYVDLVSLSVPGGMARGVVEGQLAKVNPIIDLSSLRFPLTLDSVDVDDGRVVVRGTAAWPQSG